MTTAMTVVRRAGEEEEDSRPGDQHVHCVPRGGPHPRGVLHQGLGAASQGHDRAARLQPRSRT